MDILSEILDRVKLDSSFYYKTSFTGKWGVNLPSIDKVARFHIVMEGVFNYEIPELNLEGSANEGDILIIFNGLEHNMKSNKVKSVELSMEFYSKSVHEGHLLSRGDQTKSSTKIVCGHFTFRKGEDHPLIKSLPNFIHIKKDQNSHSSSLKTILALIDTETSSETPGSLALISRLTEVVFIQALRIYSETSKNNLNFLQLTQDPQLSKAISAIHNRYFSKWTLETLAQEAGMSRTSFSSKFKEISKMTPLDYVTFYRLDVSKRLLLETDNTVAEISEKVGYSSNEYFQKLFKKSIGMTPSAFRKR